MSTFPADIRNSTPFKTDENYVSDLRKYYELKNEEKDELYNYLLTKFEITFENIPRTANNYLKINSVRIEGENVMVVKFELIYNSRSYGKFMLDKKGIREDDFEPTATPEEDEDFEYKNCAEKIAKGFLIVVLACVIKSLISYSL